MSEPESVAEEIKVYNIPAQNFPRLQEQITKLKKKAERLGCPTVTLTVVGMGYRNVTDELLGFEYKDAIYHCTIEGDPPQLNGWTLVAILEPLRNGEMLVREIPGQHCPSNYRTTDLRCDHCGVIRRRNAVYLIHNSDHGHKQVGKQCLADFLGHVDPTALLKHAEHIIDFQKLASDAEQTGWGSLGKGFIGVPIRHYVTVVATLIRQLRWVPRSQRDTDRPTANFAWDICVNPHEDYVRDEVAKNKIVATEADVRRADEALEWARAIDPEMAGSTYLHDLGASCRQEYVEWKITGYVASVVSAYQRHLDEIAERERQEAARRGARPKQAIGEIGKRLVLKDLKITMIKLLEVKYGDQEKTMVKFVDPDGNELVWFASGSPDWIEDDLIVTVKATIKAHNEFRGVPQTVLTRVVPETSESAVEAST